MAELDPTFGMALGNRDFHDSTKVTRNSTNKFVF